MKTIQTNFIFLMILICNGIIHADYNLSMQMTNNTGFPCNFTDGTKAPITVEVGQTLTYTFQSSPVSYTFGPNTQAYTPTIPNGDIKVTTNNYFYLASTGQPYYTNKTGFQLYLKYSNNSTIILNNNASVAQGVTVSQIGAELFNSGSVSNAPFIATFILDNTGAVKQTTIDITNNSNDTITNLVFQDSGRTTIGLLDILYAYNSTSIPKNSAFLSCVCNALHGFSVNIPISSNVPSNVYGAGSIINTTDQTVYLSYVGYYFPDSSTYTYWLSNLIPLTGKEQQLILSSAIAVDIDSTNIKNTGDILKNKTIDPNQTWYLTHTNGVWSLSTAAPNNTATITNNTGYTCNLVEGSQITTFQNGETKVYTFQSEPISYTFGPNVATIDASSYGEGANIYYNGSLYLQNKYAPWNNYTPFQVFVFDDLNNIKYVINKNSYNANIEYGSTVGVEPYISGTLSSGPLTAIFTMNSSTGAIEVNATYSIKTLLNNFNNPTSTIYFTNESTGGTSSINSLSAWSFLDIPTGTTSMYCTGLANGGNFTLNPTSDLNIYTNSIITNNTDAQILLQCTTSTGGSYTIYEGQSLPIVTSVTDVTLFVDGVSKGYTTIAPNTSYLITYTDPNYFITPYTPLLKNNYTSEITSLDFYNSNNQLSTTVSFLDSQETYPTPTTTSFARFQIPDLSASTTFTMPITFPELLNTVTGNTISNSSGYNVQVNYYGNYNTNNDTLLTSLPISTSNGQTIPITTGALNAQILNESGTEVIAEINGALHPGINYYILYNAGNWTLSSTPPGSTYYLTNNFNQATGTITFYNSSSQVMGTTASIAAYDSYAIPATTTRISCNGLINASSCDIEITGNNNVNIYSDYALTNNTDYDIVATYYGLITSTTVTNGTVTIPARISTSQPTFVPIVTSTTAISLTQGSNTVISQQNIVNNSSYIIIFNNPAWSLQTYTPTLNNNSSENGTDLTFYDITGSAIPSTVNGDFGSLSNAAVPINATSVGVYIYGSRVLISTTLAAQSYLFTNNTFTNLANQTANITFYSNTMNGITPNLNNPSIAISATQSIPRITSGTSVSISAGQATVIAQTSIENNTSYFINYDQQTDTWWLSIDTPTQNELLTNNYTQNATDLQFYTLDLNPTGSPITEFEAWSSTSIPSNANFAKLTDLNTNIQLYTVPNIPVNMFTGFVIKNNTTQDIALWFYDTKNNHIQLNPGILTEPNISTPLLTYTNTVAVTNAIYVDGVPTQVYIPATTISLDSSYYVIYDEDTDTWSLVATLPAENTYLTNNYDGTATNLVFLNVNNTQQGTTISTVPAHTSTLIPTTSVKAQFSYFNANMNIQIDDATSIGIFTNNYVVNNAGQTISVIYYGSAQEQISDPILTTYASNNVPIITSAAYFSILDTNGVEQITMEPITAHTDYIIDNTWTVTPITPARLTNNSGQDGTNLNFYNGNTPVGSTINPFYNQTAADIPTGGTKATTDELFNSIGSTLTVSVNDSTTSTLVTDYNLHNNSGNTVTVIFKGTINSTSNQPLNSPAISMPGFSLIPITTGAELVSVYFGSTLVITDAVIVSDTTYYINYINNVWSLDTYASIVNVTNNSTTDASNLAFYDIHNTNLATDDNFDAYSSQPIPTTATYASADFETPFASTLTIPVTGAAICHFFNTSHLTISNNTSAVIQDIGLIFYGTINNVSNSVLNDPTIVMPVNESLPILSGPESFSVVDPNDNNVVYIANYPIDANESYAVTNYYDINGNLIWTVNETVYTSTLTNNYNQEGTNLKFFNSTTTFDSTTQVGSTQTSFPAFGSAGIPTDALTSQFDVFNSTLTFPVSGSASSTVYANILYNQTGGEISVTYYGTVGGASNTQLNSPAIICNSGDMIPFLAAADYMIISSGSNTLDTRTTTYNPLPKTLAYDIVYNPSLNIIPHQLNLTNNFYQLANSISFYTIQGNFISTINNVQPFATVTIPSSPQATSAVIVYDDYTITIPLSTSNSSQVLTHNILTNNANDDLTIIFSDKQGKSVNTEPIVLITGSFIPFITGTEQVTVLNNDTVIIANETIIPTESYRIQQQNNFQQRLVRAESDNPELSPTSSALGVIRMLGGSTASKLSILPVEIYGNNISLFKEFLYIDVYAKVITDLAARAATALVVNTLIDTYAQNNSANNFNYVAYLYQINDELRIAQALLRSQYPNSVQQIDLFFRYVLKRSNSTLLQ